MRSSAVQPDYLYVAEPSFKAALALDFDDQLEAHRVDCEAMAMVTIVQDRRRGQPDRNERGENMSETEILRCFRGGEDNRIESISC